MTLMLLTLSGVFLFVPGVFEPFQNPVTADEQTTADRMADRLVTASSVEGAKNTVEYDTMETLIADEFDRVKARSALPAGGSVNVTVEDTHDGTTRVLIGNGSSYVDNREPTATTVRIVRLANDSSDRCEPVCRLVVRVW